MSTTKIPPFLLVLFIGLTFLGYAYLERYEYTNVSGGVAIYDKWTREYKICEYDECIEIFDPSITKTTQLQKK